MADDKKEPWLSYLALTTVIFAVGFVLTALALSARSTDRPVGGRSHDTTPVIVHHERDPELNVDVPGFIPDDYVPDTGQRLDLYKRLSGARDEFHLAAIVQNLKTLANHFWRPPPNAMTA